VEVEKGELVGLMGEVHALLMVDTNRHHNYGE